MQWRGRYGETDTQVAGTINQPQEKQDRNLIALNMSYQNMVTKYTSAFASNIQNMYIHFRLHNDTKTLKCWRQHFLVLPDFIIFFPMLNSFVYEVSLNIQQRHIIFLQGLIRPLMFFHRFDLPDLLTNTKHKSYMWQRSKMRLWEAKPFSQVTVVLNYMQTRKIVQNLFLCFSGSLEKSLPGSYGWEELHWKINKITDKG